jgi:hypothetical protein
VTINEVLLQNNGQQIEFIQADVAGPQRRRSPQLLSACGLVEEILDTRGPSSILELGGLLLPS